MSDARIEHAIVGAVFWLAFLLLRNPRCSGGQIVAMLPAALIGTWVPDWDLFLGIGYHRSPITHSALPVILLSLLISSRAAYGVVVGFGLGVASHLFWDCIYYGNVHWIPGRFWDRTFLIANAAGIVLWAFSSDLAKRRRTRRKRHLAEQGEKQQLESGSSATAHYDSPDASDAGTHRGHS
jgi:hypothetical protein